MNNKVKVAIIGLGFGKEFIPIYQRHPNSGSVVICTRNPETLKEVGDYFNIPEEDRFTNFYDVLKREDIDAIHINTPIPLHAEQAIAGLEAGKHVACTVPAATNIEDLKKIVLAQKKSGKNYMMMETAVYTREFLYAKDLLEKGEFGSISFLRGAHYQNMDGWPGYWYGFPPMYYATHAVAPLFALADAYPVKVHCFGSGRVEEDLVKPYGNPYRFESALFKLSKNDLAAEVSRFLFETSRQYTESFNIYAEKMSFEWQQIEPGTPVLFKGEEAIKVNEVPDRQDLLPKEIASFTQRGVYGDDETHLSFIQGAGHGGSHPHLANEFVMSIVENRQPYVHAVTAAYWTAAGICAHESAMNDGKEIMLPEFENL
jgi:predicted dehydrogenase